MSVISMLEEITIIVCNYYQISETEIKEVTKKSDIVQARQIIFSMAKNLCGKNITLERIGRYFGKGHATVIHGINHIGNLLSYDKQLQRDYFRIDAMVAKFLAGRPTITKKEILQDLSNVGKFLTLENVIEKIRNSEIV